MSSELHALCDTSSYSEILTRLSNPLYTSEVSRVDPSSGFLPVHTLLAKPGGELAANKKLLHVVRLLIGGLDSGLRSQSNGGWLPLHYAVYYKHSYSTILCLIGTDLVTIQEIQKTKNKKGQTPLDILQSIDVKDERYLLFVTTILKVKSLEQLEEIRRAVDSEEGKIRERLVSANALERSSSGTGKGLLRSSSGSSSSPAEVLEDTTPTPPLATCLPIPPTVDISGVTINELPTPSTPTTQSSSFAVHVKCVCKSGTSQKFKELTLINATKSLLEPGVLRFDLLQDQYDKHCFLLVEVYTDQVHAPAAHKETSHYKEWRENVAELMEIPRMSEKWNTIFPVGVEGWKS